MEINGSEQTRLYNIFPAIFHIRAYKNNTAFSSFRPSQLTNVHWGRKASKSGKRASMQIRRIMNTECRVNQCKDVLCGIICKTHRVLSLLRHLRTLSVTVFFLTSSPSSRILPSEQLFNDEKYGLYNPSRVPEQNVDSRRPRKHDRLRQYPGAPNLVSPVVFSKHFA